ncbi:hypothetical protein HDZ31DRAFT_33767 [Schizophyllum fasciatum]
MHRALLIPELIALVCAMCRTTGDACAMARTCRAWYAPALDRIWETIHGDGLMLLFCMLPPDVLVPAQTVWNAERSEYRHSLPRWHKAPSQDDYERLYKFSSRVKSMAASTSLRTLTRMLYEHPPARPLFPKLQDLTLRISREEAILDATILSPLRSAALTRLDIVTDRKRGAELTLDLESVYSACADNVQVSIFARLLSAAPTLSGSRREIVHKLTLNDLDNETLATAAALPNLQILNIQRSAVPHPQLPETSALSSIEHPFRALKVLELFTYEDSRPFVQDILRHCGHVALSALILDIEHDDEDRQMNPSHHWHDLFAALNRHCAHNSLRQLQVCDAGETARIYADSLRRLLPFSELRVLSIRSKGGIGLDDDDVAPLMQGWAKLRSLELVPSVYMGDQDDPTFSFDDEDANHFAHARYVNTCTVAGLLEIVRHAASLERLTLTVDFVNNVPDFDDDEIPRLPRTARIWWLDFWNSQVKSPSAVAEILHRVFPLAASSIVTSVLDDKEHFEDSPDEDSAAKWEEVGKIVYLVRRIERETDQRMARRLAEVASPSFPVNRIIDSCHKVSLS